ICIQVCGPVEGRGAVVGQQLVRELAADALGELLGQCEVRGAGLHPDHVCVGSVGLCTCDAGLQARLDVVVTLGGALAGDEGNVALINVRGDQGGGLCVGTGDDDGRGVGDVRCQAGGVQGADVLLGR